MEESDYERQRQENIAKNKALLKQLQLDSLSSAVPNARKPARSTPAKSSSTTKRVKKEAVESPQPRRTSSRLAGLAADSPAEKRKRADEQDRLQVAERTKRERVAGELKFDIAGDKYAATFTHDDVKATGDKSLKAVRERMMGLKLWDGFEPAALKVTPERIYALEFHPRADRPLVFAGDKVGNLGILDAGAGADQAAKKDTGDDNDEDGDEATPDITTFKLHARTLTTFLFAPASPQTLYSASYDGSVRTLDLASGKSNEVFTPAHVDDALSGLQMLDAHTALLSTLDGLVIRKDFRTPAADTQGRWQCSDKKIGGLGVLPGATHVFATASLDRTVKIWDLRMCEQTDEPFSIGEHTSRLSVSAAHWSRTGALATTSYDDTVKIYTLPAAHTWAKGHTLAGLTPNCSVRHNNQTGRWVTILRAVWQEAPLDGRQKLVVANMNRSIDVFADDGSQLAQLGDPDRISAVPAVAKLHRCNEWVAGGTGSGKVVLFM